jgi:hypothetical protein
MVRQEQTMSKRAKDSGENEAQDLYDHRHDPDEWEEAPERIEVRPARSSVLSVRLPRAEFDALEKAAAAAGETLSEYVRRAVLQRAQGMGMPARLGIVGRSVAVVGQPLEVTDLRIWNSSGGMAEVREGDRKLAGM